MQAKIKDLRSGIDKLVADMKSGDENLIKQAEAKYEEIDRKITETVVNYILAHTDKQSAAKNLYDFRYNIDEEQQMKSSPKQILLSSPFRESAI